MGMKGKIRLNSMFTFNTFIQFHMVIYEKMGIKNQALILLYIALGYL